MGFARDEVVTFEIRYTGKKESRLKEMTTYERIASVEYATQASMQYGDTDGSVVHTDRSEKCCPEYNGSVI